MDRMELGLCVTLHSGFHIYSMSVAKVEQRRGTLHSTRVVWRFQKSHSFKKHLSYFLWRCGPTLAMVSSFLMFLDHTQRHITVGRTPLDEWLARRRDLYLTTHNTQQTGGIRTHKLSRRAAADPYLRPRGYWDRNLYYIKEKINKHYY